MPYITREDGERFIIPSYRDVLTAKKPNLLKREILLLANNYGQYVTLQKKGPAQFEVAFSPEPGTLLGESIWHYFQRPADLIYCEIVPNTTEAILVIVKSGSVYLDGSFPIDSIPEELIVFQTQENHFEIYLYGDVPISETPEEGKFSFEASSVKKFTILDRPVFPTLPLVKGFQLQLVTTVLKTQGIGVFPLKPALTLLGIVLVVWGGWYFFTMPKTKLPTAFVGFINPYQTYINRLQSPDPVLEIAAISKNMVSLSTIPGWVPEKFSYTKGRLTANIKSLGARTNILFDWAKKNKANIAIIQTGFIASIEVPLYNRPPPTSIHSMNNIIANLIDRFSYVLPGNHLTITNSTNQGKFIETVFVLQFNNVTPTTFDLIGKQFANMPIIISTVELTIANNSLSGTIEFSALGN